LRILLFLGLVIPDLVNAVGACTPQQVSALLAAASESNKVVSLNCNVKLNSNAYGISKTIQISGAEASGMTLDCNGSSLHPTFEAAAVEIYSTDNGDGTWSRPENITVKNCRITGRGAANVVRIWGRPAKSSSLSLGHTARMQAAAPKNVILKNLTITAAGGIPLYVYPGVTHVSLLNSEIKGTGESVSIYLDAESGHHTVKDNYIHLDSSGREQLAIDGSAYNRIIHNRFSGLDTGGIYIYRNCGEDGEVRHQTPHHNQIINNVFYYNTYGGFNPSIWIASRNGNRGYCDDDKGYPFGSSASDLDYARYNVVAQNQIYKLPISMMIRVNDSPNYLFENASVQTPLSRSSGCFVDLTSSKVFIHDGDYAAKRFGTSTGLRYICNDGTVTSSGPVPTDRIAFECAVSTNNAGCSRAFVCPAGKKVVGLKLGCNLELTDLPTSAIETLPWDRVKVFRASDHFLEGWCGLNPDKLIHFGEVDLAPLLGTANGFTANCKEHDANGGDCVVRGQALCL
jgi:hypothetical protein